MCVERGKVLFPKGGELASPSKGARCQKERSSASNRVSRRDRTSQRARAPSGTRCARRAPGPLRGDRAARRPEIQREIAPGKERVSFSLSQSVLPPSLRRTRPCSPGVARVRGAGGRRAHLRVRRPLRDPRDARGRRSSANGVSQQRISLSLSLSRVFGRARGCAGKDTHTLESGSLSNVPIFFRSTRSSSSERSKYFRAVVGWCLARAVTVGERDDEERTGWVPGSYLESEQWLV